MYNLEHENASLSLSLSLARALSRFCRLLSISNPFTPPVLPSSAFIYESAFCFHSILSNII